MSKMGLFHMNKQKEMSFKSTPRKALPPDNNLMACGPEACHCVSNSELDRRYDVLRAEEHARIDGLCGDEWKREVSTSAVNRDRNRYNNITPWDHSRVKLPVKEGGNDYINASWIQLGHKVYLATQGPLGSTSGHFWQMAYAYGGSPIVIVMLTALYENSVEKCAKYWPDTREQPLHYGPEKDFAFGMSVEFEKSTQNEHYNYSQLRLIPDDPQFPPKTVHHIYYHSWSDFTKPNMDADIRSVIHLVNNNLKNPGAPPIIHCSAGIGRTGTFIALDSLLSKIDHDISTSYSPLASPVWSNDTASFINKDTLFTGPSEDHADLGSPHPTNGVASVGAHSTGSQAIASSFDPTSPRSMRRGPSSPGSPPTDVLSAHKVEVPVNGNKISALSAALNQEKDTKLEGVDEESVIVEADGTFEDAQESVPETNGTVNGTANGTANGTVNGTANGTPNGKVNGKVPGLESPHISVTESVDPDATNATADGSPGPQLNGDAKINGTAAQAIAERRESSAKTGPVLYSSSKTGPCISNKALSENVKSLTPSKINVVDWYNEGEDPVMSVIKLMRVQRPKMVQGTEQLGYIYDQFEVGQQFAKAYGPEPIRRRATVTDFGPSSVRSNMSIEPTGRKNSVSSTSSQGKKLTRTHTFTTISSLFSSNGNRQRGASTSSASVKRQNSLRS